MAEFGHKVQVIRCCGRVGGMSVDFGPLLGSCVEGSDVKWHTKPEFQASFARVKKFREA